MGQGKEDVAYRQKSGAGPERGRGDAVRADPDGKRWARRAQPRGQQRVTASIGDGSVKIAPANDTKQSRAMWGTTRALVNNMVVGVSKGFSVGLEINGVRYRAAVQGHVLNLHSAIRTISRLRSPPTSRSPANGQPRSQSACRSPTRRAGRGRDRAIARPSPTRARGSSTRMKPAPQRRQKEVTTMAQHAKVLFQRRRQRVRRRLFRAANGRPRLSVFRSSKHIYAQVIDDAAGHTLAAASKSRCRCEADSEDRAPTSPPLVRSVS